MVKLKKQERQSSLESHISDDPFLTDEQLANIFGVSIQTIRLDRLELNIPELRARIKNVAREGVDKIRSLSIQEVVGEIIDIELNKSALSLFIVEESHVFEKNQIARGHFLFAQANSLCVALIDEPLALTQHAAVDFKRPAKLNDKVVAKAKVTTMDNNKAHIEVESKVDGKVIFTGKFEMYYKNEGE
ncbi:MULTISPECIES: transcription factor FapR [Jeotgalicoccus]|uniref:Transcription factor FapR n=2 Tax=Jeotgalicoccus TaxID=227979 RepID=A0A3E0ATN8_9STAP|nr:MULTISPECIES: transcription factor FapR [Jeotgalicoccus]MBF0752707.1 transcription factor FapR [Jeotgalicoccus nanhaiensis]REG23100.1 acyl-coenzyme A thioesterase PaaI-like protein [Jeotgalicoccus halotolerans]TFU62876.1 transcription factor FapR [Jeotgalicoccus nanhaiensis]